MHNSICRFAPAGKAPDVIQIIHFVYESSMGDLTQSRLETAYKMGLVVSGTAAINYYGKKETLAPGTLFFAFPAVPYVLESSPDFTYLYISYLGLRANMLMDRLRINPEHFVFHGFENSIPIWMDTIRTADIMPELAAESMLLLTLMKLGNTLHAGEKQDVSQTAQTMLLVKKAIDDGFASSELSVEQLSRDFGYHRKYLSSAFKKHFKVGIQEYLTQLRVNRACLLIEQGYTCVKDIAPLCGYSDAMYFSKVFRKKMDMPPKTYIQTRGTLSRD